MSPFFTVLNLFLATSAFASPFNASNWERCGTHATDAHVAAVQAAMKEYNMYNTVNDSYNEDRALDVTFVVHWHAIATSNDKADGYLSDETISNQMGVLGLNYRNGMSNVHFQLQITTRNIANDWYTNTRASAENLAMRQNFFDPNGTSGILGYSSFPSDYSGNPQLDGVVVLKDTLYGGSLAPYNQGKTLVHEIGHWLGLFHTFKGGCSEPNDGVSDTPQEAQPGYGCPTGRDSCPNDPGVDPIWNYMDYSDDSCMNYFTSGQNNLVNAMVAQYRS